MRMKMKRDLDGGFQPTHQMIGIERGQESGHIFDTNRIGPQIFQLPGQIHKTVDAMDRADGVGKGGFSSGHGGTCDLELALSLVKLGRIGQHIFYRRAGPELFAPYAGGELQITKVNTIGRPQPNLMGGARRDDVGASLQLANLTTTITPDGRVHATLENPSTITVSNVPMIDGKAVMPTVHALISARAAYAKAQMEKRQAETATPASTSTLTAKAAPAPIAVASTAPAL